MGKCSKKVTFKKPGHAKATRRVDLKPWSAPVKEALSENARKRYFELTEKTEKAAQDMASIAMETIASTLDMNDTLEILNNDECSEVMAEDTSEYLLEFTEKSNFLQDTRANVKEKDKANSTTIHTVFQKTRSEIKDKRVKQDKKICEKEYIEVARIKAKKAAEDMTKFALSSIESAMNNKEIVKGKFDMESSVGVKSLQGDCMWYLLWSEEHGREYYYQPSTKTSLWPSENYRTYLAPGSIATSASETNKLDSEMEKKGVFDVTQYNLEYCQIDDFLPRRDHIACVESTKKRHCKGKNDRSIFFRRKESIRKKTSQNPGWCYTLVILVASIIYFRINFKRLRSLCSMSKFLKVDVNSNINSINSNQKKMNAPNAGDKLEIKGSRDTNIKHKKRHHRQEYFADTTLLNRLNIPEHQRVLARKSQRLFGTQEEIGIHSSMSDLLKEVKMEPSMNELLMNIFPSYIEQKVSDVQVQAQRVSVNMTVSRDERKRKITDDRSSHLCKVPVLNKLLNCNPGRSFPEPRKSLLNHVKENMAV